MKDEKFYIAGTITAETLGEICRSIGDYFTVRGVGDSIQFTRITT